jgi:calcium/calmodulin-dependent protein kinase I
MIWGDRDALKDEVQNLKTLREGPNIVQLYEVFEEQDYCFLVMEIMKGGELFDRIIEKRTFTEKEARNSMRCVLGALEYMHDRRVAHRDLKPENLLLAVRTSSTQICVCVCGLFVSRIYYSLTYNHNHNHAYNHSFTLFQHTDSLVPVKLADFGFAKCVKEKNACRTLCGTPGYLAPEILERWPAYDTKCDIWSVGVILFLLLGGYLPFDDDNEDVVYDKTRNGQYDFRPQFWRNISSGAKDLVTQCLTINPNKRVNATRALNHEWMTAAGAASSQLENPLNVDKLKNSMQGKRKVKAAIHTLLAANRLQQLKEGFGNYLDKRRTESVVSHFSHMTGGRTVATNFQEDSNTGNPFQHFYTLGEFLGKGDHAIVHGCTRKSTDMVYTVKQAMHSSGGNDDNDDFDSSLRDEISALRLLRGGPHIIRLYDIFEQDDSTYLVMEEMKGGNLLARIVEKEVYTEREARQLCKILFTAVDYCHKKHIAHRDIKPENLLLVVRVPCVCVCVLGRDETGVSRSDRVVQHAYLIFDFSLSCACMCCRRKAMMRV